MGDGCNTRFWKDLWLDDKPLMLAYPIIYGLCFNKNISVADAFTLGLDNFSFRRTLLGESLDLWDRCKDRCGDLVLSDQKESNGH